MKKLLETAIQASLEAGAQIMSIYESGDFDINLKKDDSPLTKADIASHEAIMSYLEGTNIPVLSEEGKDIDYNKRRNWSQLWIVDPLDGTKEFIKKNGEFTVNIALIEEQKPILGVIYVPALKTLYFAEKNLGSFKVSGISDDQPKEILKKAKKLPLINERQPYTVVASKSHLSPETEDYILELKRTHGSVETISKGSSLKLCMVAEGIADCYPRFAPTMEWDTAAGHAICSFAGKVVIDQNSQEEMTYNRQNLLNHWFLVK